MRKTIQFLGFICALVLLNSCYKSPDLGGLSSELVVATDRDLDIDFSSTDYNNYFLSDEINLVTNKPGDEDPIPPAQAAKIIGKIEANMNARGYTRITTSYDDPDVDLGLVASVIRVTNTGQSCTGWWGGYPGYYPPWGWGGYYPYCSYYKYDTGTLLIEMVDLANPTDIDNNTEPEYKTLWHSASFGVLSTYEETNVNRAVNSVDQAFDQSQYIQKN